MLLQKLVPDEEHCVKSPYMTEVKLPEHAYSANEVAQEEAGIAALMI